MSTSARLPLDRRPRRAKVVREPSQSAAARSLRRTATPTTGRVWSRVALPGPTRAAAGVPWSESLGSLCALVLLFVPVALFSHFSPVVPVAAGVALAVASYLLWARRVAVGDRWIAVRQVGRYHVATVDHVHHLELRSGQRGGTLCLHTDDGRCVRLRHAELAQPDLNRALRELAALHGGTRDGLVESFLELPHDPDRLRARYRAGVA